MIQSHDLPNILNYCLLNYTIWQEALNFLHRASEKNLLTSALEKQTLRKAAVQMVLAYERNQGRELPIGAITRFERLLTERWERTHMSQELSSYQLTKAT